MKDLSLVVRNRITKLKKDLGITNNKLDIGIKKIFKNMVEETESDKNIFSKQLYIITKNEKIIILLGSKNLNLSLIRKEWKKADSKVSFIKYLTSEKGFTKFEKAIFYVEEV
jgi:cell division protein FtsL